MRMKRTSGSLLYCLLDYAENIILNTLQQTLLTMFEDMSKIKFPEKLIRFLTSPCSTPLTTQKCNWDYEILSKPRVKKYGRELNCVLSQCSSYEGHILGILYWSTSPDTPGHSHQWLVRVWRFPSDLQNHPNVCLNSGRCLCFVRRY